MSQTVAADILFNPVVWKDHVEAYFKQLLVWGQSATRFDDLMAGPGETITWPYFKSIGAAEEPLEAASLAVDKMGDDSFTSSVKEVGKAVQFTDKSLVVSAASQSVIFGEAQRQIARRMAEKVDQDIVAEIYGGGNYVSGYTGTSASDVMKITTLVQGKIRGFGDRHLEGAVVYMHSHQLETLMTDATAGFLKLDANDPMARVSGFVGRLAGLAIVTSDLVPVTTDGIAVGVDSYDAIVLKPNSHGLIVKKDFGNFESDRDILARSTVVSMTAWYSVKSFHAKVSSDDLRAARIRTA